MSYQNSRTSVPSPKPPTPSPKPPPTPSPKPPPTPSPTPLHPVHLNLASYYKGTDLQGNAVDTPPCLAPNNLFQCNDKSSYVCADPSQQGDFWRHCPDAHKHHKHHHHKKDGKGSKGAMIAFWCILGVIIALLVGIIIFSSVTKKSANSVSMVRRRRR
jgi:hypothetical protein